MQISPDQLQTVLSSQLKNPPGLDGQSEVMPSNRKKLKDPKQIKAEKESATALCLYQQDDEWFFPLIHRNEYPGKHSGQISFPGGKVEPEDNSYEHTAYRETWEEIGINDQQLELVGQLTQVYIPPSGFMIYPFVGIVQTEFEFNPSPDEVQSVIEVPLAELLDPNRLRSKQMRFGPNLKEEVPYYDLQGHVVWGATAMILAEFKTLLQRV